MNKRQAKKRYKKAIEFIKNTSRKKQKKSVVIINQMYIDENGKMCDPQSANSRFVILKRPIIKYYKKNIDN